MKFRAKVIPSGNATAVEIPANVLKALGSGGVRVRHRARQDHGNRRRNGSWLSRRARRYSDGLALAPQTRGAFKRCHTVR